MAVGSNRHLYKGGAYKHMIHMDDETLRKLKSTLLLILDDLTEACGKHGIRFTLSGGSVLGAVRHKGFIPWDDDLDINISRKDYKKLLEIFDEELGDRYVMMAPELGRGYGMAHSQMRKKGTLYRSYNELGMPDEECGIFLDFFVMENVPDNPVLRRLHGFLCLGAGYMLTCRKTYEGWKYLKDVVNGEEGLYRAFLKKYRIGRLFAWLPLDTAARFTASCYSLCKNNRSRYVSIPAGREHYFGEIYKRSSVCRRRRGPFEDRIVPLPKEAEEYVSILYGPDYMELPPVEKRESHPIMELKFGDENE